MVKISVIVPVYQTEPYLAQCIESVLAQTFRDLELILVDDGSPDNCGAICDAYAAKDSRICVIHQSNAGRSVARNVGIHKAKGAYIAFVDSDDFIANNMMEQLYRKCVDENADMAMCDVAVYVDGEGVRPHESPMTDMCLNQAELVEEMIGPEAWHYIVPWNKLFRKEVFETIRFPEGYIHEDAAIAHRIAGMCQKVAQIPEELYYYRQNMQGTMNSAYSIKRTDNLMALADRIAYAGERNWGNMLECTISRYVYQFFDDYFKFPRTEENQKYFQRMEKSLEMALPFIRHSKAVSFRHKLYLTAIHIAPVTFWKWKQGR